jgi:hypothetical protein
MLEWIKSAVNIDSPVSSKSIALLLSAVIGSVFALMLGIAIIIDVSKDGKIDTNLTEMSLLLAADGGFIWMGGQNKVQSEKIKK